MNINREVTYNWKSQVLLLIGALLINVTLVSGVKADGFYKEVKYKDIEKQPYRMVDLGAAKFLSTEDILAIDWSKGDYTYFTVALLAKYQAKDRVEKGSEEWKRLKLSIEKQEQFLTDFTAKKLEEDMKKQKIRTKEMMQEVAKEVNRRAISRGA